MGKTVFTASVIEKFLTYPELSGKLIGFVLLNYQDKHRSNPVSILKLLLSQLATVFPHLESDPRLRLDESVPTLEEFETLKSFYLEILTSLADINHQADNMLIIFDGIDEVLDNDLRVAFLSLFTPEFLDRLPKWVKIYVTSRADPDIEKFLHSSCYSIEDNMNKHTEDLRYCLTKQLVECGLALEDDYHQLVNQAFERSEHIFAYMSIIIEYIRNQANNVSVNVNELISSMAHVSPLLSKHYDKTIMKLVSQNNVISIRFFCIMVACKEPFTVNLIQWMLEIESEVSYFNQLMELLCSEFMIGDDMKIYPRSKSFFQWLSSQHDYFDGLNPVIVGNTIISRRLLALIVLTLPLTFHTALNDLGSNYLEVIPWSDDEMASIEKYFFSHILDHLDNSGDSNFECLSYHILTSLTWLQACLKRLGMVKVIDLYLKQVQNHTWLVNDIQARTNVKLLLQLLLHLATVMGEDHAIGLDELYSLVLEKFRQVKSMKMQQWLEEAETYFKRHPIGKVASLHNESVMSGKDSEDDHLMLASDEKYDNNPTVVVQVPFELLPLWIKDSEVCRLQFECELTVKMGHDVAILCPLDCSDFKLAIQTRDDLIRVMNMLSYWNTVFPDELYDYCFQGTNYRDMLEVINKYGRTFEDIVRVCELYGSILSHRKLSSPIDQCITILECSILRNDVKLLKYVTEYKGFSLLNDVATQISYRLTLLASRLGTLDILRNIPYIDKIVTIGCSRLAIKYSHSECFNFLCSVGCEWSPIRESTDIDKYNLLGRDSPTDLLEDILINSNVDIDIQDDEGRTALMMCTLDSNSSAVEMLLNHGADVNLKSKLGETVLFYASKSDNNAITSLLLQYGADVNAVSNYGNTPLHGVKSIEVGQLLLLHGVDVNHQNKFGETALYLASKYRNEQLLSLLLRHNADPNIAAANYETPLYAAVNNNHISIVQTLLQVGADPNITTDEGLTLLWLAAENGYFLILDMLIEHSTRLIDSVDDYSWLHFYHSAYLGNTGRLSWLIEDHYDVNVVNSKNETPLYAAVYSGNSQAVRLLMDHEVDINMLTDDQDTPLRYAIQSKNFDTLKLLLLQSGNVVNHLSHFIGNGNSIILQQIESLLSKNACTFFASKINDFLSQYLGGSRKWVMNEVMGWFNDRSGDRKLFWLKANAG